MENNEIYIDGVNVAGCNAYKEGHCLDKTAILLCDTNKCSNYKNCYYKQLKRLEQENRELKEENETLNYQWHKQSEIGDEWYKVAEKYKTALEEIKETIKSYDLTVDNGASVDTIYTIRKVIKEVLG